MEHLQSLLIERFKPHPLVIGIDTPDQSTLVVKLAGGQSASVSLANLAADIEANVSDQASIVDNFVARVSAVFDRIAATGTAKRSIEAANLYPVVRARSYLKLSASDAQKAGAKDHSLLFRPLAADLIVLVGNRSDGTISMLSPGDGADLNVSDEALFDQAMKQLRVAAEAMEQFAIGSAASLAIEPALLNPSLLLLPELWNELEVKFGRDLKVIVPDHETIVVASSGDELLLRSIIQHFAAKPGARPLSKRIYHRSGGDWIAKD